MYNVLLLKMKALKAFVSKLNVDSKYIPAGLHKEWENITKEISDDAMCGKIEEFTEFFKKHKSKIICKKDSEKFKELYHVVCEMMNEQSDCESTLEEPVDEESNSSHNSLPDTPDDEDNTVHDSSTRELTNHDDLCAVEDMLDNEISCYSKYTERNPMLGISRDGTKWKLRSTEYCCNMQSINKDKLIKIIMEKIKDDKKRNQISECVILEKIIYKTKNIVIYGTYENPLFDIHHMINLLELEAEDKKYQLNKNKITHYNVKKNSHGGYIIKELIPEKAMYSIILSSNSNFSKDIPVIQKQIRDCLEKIKERTKYSETHNDEIMTDRRNNVITVHTSYPHNIIENNGSDNGDDNSIVEENESDSDDDIDAIKNNETCDDTNVDEENELVNSDNINAIEEMLDMEINSYNKYDENHPMLGISRYETRWRLISREHDCNTKSVDKNKLIKIIIDKINGTYNQYIRTDCLPQGKIKYENKYVIIYGTIDVPLFDIQHVIKLLNLTDEDQKYRDNKNMITHYGFKKNKYGGYVVKEFISEESMYDIVMSSNSEFSKKFKKDVSKMLVRMRRRGKLIITNEQITLSDVPKSSNETKNMNINHDFIESLIDKSPGMSYDDEHVSCYVKQLIKEGMSIVLSKYSKKHVLYGMITTLVDQTGLNRVLIKFGYSENIYKRIQELRDNYKSNFYIVRIKVIHGESTEREFHKILKEKYPKHNVDITIKSKSKDEIYALDESLIIEFDNFNEEINCDTEIEQHNLFTSELENKVINESIGVVMGMEDQELKMRAYDKHIDLMKHCSH